MAEDDQNRPGDSRPTAAEEGERGASWGEKKKAPISFGVPVTDQAWNVVSTDSLAGPISKAQPLKPPAPLSPPRKGTIPPTASKPSTPQPPKPNPTDRSVEARQETLPQRAIAKPAPPPVTPPPEITRSETSGNNTLSQSTDLVEKLPPAPAGEEPQQGQPTLDAAPATAKPQPKPRKEKLDAPSAAVGSSVRSPAGASTDANVPRSKRLTFPKIRTAVPPPPLVENDQPAELPWWSRIQGRAWHQMPAWLVSLVIHFVVVILLALFSMAAYVREPHEISATYAEHLGEQLEHEILMLDAADFEIDADTGSLEQLTLTDEVPLPRALMQLALTGSDAARLDHEATLGVDLVARGEGATKRALLKAYGGNATTEQAVAEALLWLKRNQLKDGSWSLKEDYADGAGVENKVAATAMALLAFQGAGHTDRSGDHAKVVARGWKYLLGKLDADGNFIHDPIPNQHKTYSQAQATIALCELYAMTGDPALKEKAQTAINYAVAWQAAEGGWRYVPKSESDLSVTGWYVMGLQSARMGNLDVPEQTLANVGRFLETVASMPTADQNFLPGSRYQYRDSRAEKFSPAMTAEGLLCRQYLGWRQDDPRLQAGMQYLLANPIEWNKPDVYYWYYATQVAHHLEGTTWRDWNENLRQVIPENQVKSGREKGSWSPANDENGVKAGRLFMTCFCTYMLEVYYRHLPIYSKHHFSGS